MCYFSLETGHKIEKAKIGETLIRGRYKQHAVLKTKSGELRCIRHGSEMQIELNFDLQYFDHPVMYQPDSTKPPIPTKQILKWQGKSATVKLVQWQSYTRAASDALELPGGIVVHLEWIAEGTRFMRTRKVRKDKGVRKPRNLARLLGLDQIKADIPVRKTVKV
jgi:hypothetical protein